MTEHFIATYGERRIELVTGRGARLTSSEGDEYVDLVAGIAVSSLGHGHPALAASIAEQADRLIHVSNLYHTRPACDLAARLYELTGGMRSFFCNSGAEAVEAALKIARKLGAETGRSRIVCAEGSFHGRTLGALSATGQPGKREAFHPLLEGFVHVPYGDADALQTELAEGDVAAVLIEPIQGEAGVVVPPEGYLTDAASACRDAGALFMLDEVQTGVARTGRWWAHQHEGVSPDVMTLAKGLGGGLPIGACLAGPAAAGVLGPGDHASTFGGGPVQCAAALTVLDVIEDGGLVEHGSHLGKLALEQLADGLDGCDVRGRGLLIGVELPRDRAAEVVEGCARRGVLVNNATPNVLRIAPPLVIEGDELSEALEVVVEVCGEVAAA